VETTATPACEDALSRAQRLTPEEQVALAQALVAAVRQQLTKRPQHSFLELQSLGKQVWEGVDAQVYAKCERDSWNG
jgi:hypothetical protein